MMTDYAEYAERIADDKKPVMDLQEFITYYLSLSDEQQRLFEQLLSSVKDQGC